ncbi:MAG: hypothetical protein ACK41Q_13400 [Candidatus Brocadia sp.]
MGKIIVYQIGRLDINAFERLKFEINGSVVENSLSSFALKETLSKEGYKTEVILLYPISLPFNPSLINDRFKLSCSASCYEKLKSALNNPENYLKNPLEFFQDHPHTQESADFEILHSLGEYKTLSRPVEFKCHYQDIVLMILTDMIKRYLTGENEIKKIFIDISSGHNIKGMSIIKI